MKKLMLCTLSALVLAGCANDGSVYRSDVYTAYQVNQAQEVKVVRIISVMPARVAVGNASGREEGLQVGAILGALAGAAVGASVSNSPDAVVAGTIAGGALGGLGGRAASGRSQNLVDGVQITFRMGDKIYNSAQVGRVCEFRVGDAVMISPSPHETRIQPNNPYGCGQSK